MPTPSQFRAAVAARYVAGQIIAGKYRLDGLLGEGGMGAVWRALNLQLEAPVALKLIRADLDGAQLGLRLKQEARATAKLGHPAIVRVFDVGESELGDPFIVMELLSGQSLAALLAIEKRLPSVRAVQLLLPIAEALAAAHAKGIIHRDLKPDNVFLTLADERIQPKLLDFGIAKLTDPKSHDTKLTQAGVVLGSPDYMSSEQARGCDDVDQRTDVWSFSAMLYEVMAGRTPFSGANHRALLRSIVEDDPVPLMDLAAADEHLWAIVQRGLAKNVDDRFRSMDELGRALAEWLIRHGVQEDVSGGSLDAKWLGRTSDPTGQRMSGASFASLTGTRESGVRSAWQSAATLAATAVAPAAAPSSSTAAPHRRRHFIVLGAFGLLAAALAVALVASRHDGSASPLARDAEAPPARQPVVSAAASPAVAPAPPAVVTDATPAPGRSAAHAPPAASSPLKPGKKAHPPGNSVTAKATGSAPVAPKSDLLSPY